MCWGRSKGIEGRQKGVLRIPKEKLQRLSSIRRKKAEFDELGGTSCPTGQKLYKIVNANVKKDASNA